MAKYVLAISGGIDSMALLDLVANDYGGFRRQHFASAKWPDDFVVAHFDHGIRGNESHNDAEFVRTTVRQRYGLLVQIGRGELPADTSEEVARQARYQFLNQVVERWSDEGVATMIVTAHHRDDLLETVAMNLIRGTGWRGLAPMSQRNVIRPLLGWNKVDIARYALEHNLAWREDQTNYSTKYFRNRLRSVLAGCSETDKQQLANLVLQQINLRKQIDSEVDEYVLRHVTHDDGNNALCIRRYDLIMLPSEVARQVLWHITDGKLTTPQLEDLLLFVKLGRPSKRMAWKDVAVRLAKSTVLIRIAN